MGGAVEAEWKLQHVLEIVRQHDLAALVGEPVGIERNERPAQDEEQRKADPSGDERGELRPIRRAAEALRARQGIDDATEQHWLGEARGGERHIGERQNPAELPLRAEQAEHAGVEANHGVKGRLRTLIAGSSSACWAGSSTADRRAAALASRSRPWRKAPARNRSSSRRGGAARSNRGRSAAGRA